MPVHHVYIFLRFQCVSLGQGKQLCRSLCQKEIRFGGGVVSLQGVLVCMGERESEHACASACASVCCLLMSVMRFDKVSTVLWHQFCYQTFFFLIILVLAHIEGCILLLLCCSFRSDSAHYEKWFPLETAEREGGGERESVHTHTHTHTHTEQNW